MASRPSTAVKADPFQDTMQVCNMFLEGLDCARALSISILADHYLPDDPVSFSAEVKSLQMAPESYAIDDVNSFMADYQATVLYSKLPSPSKNPALKAAAIRGFEEGELHCSLMNKLWFNESRIEALLFKEGVDIRRIRSIISEILGRAPSLKTLAKRGRWTTGSSYLLRKKDSSEAAKCTYGVSITRNLAKLISSTLSPDDIPLINWSAPWLLTPGNLVDTVPKNLTTDRTIAKEPEINMFFQNAIGLTIRERLLRVGIDLNDQSNNQWACMHAQRLGLATLDLKNASNSICLGLVVSLLPPDWSDLIVATRSSHGTLSTRKSAIDREAEWFEYAMVSSMGNGFTFELETLLFFAICLAAGVPDYKCYVYGDDIIIPQDNVKSVVPVLELCGFCINTEKSFLQGTFFESCGVYSFNGVDVTPIKIKELLYGPKDCIILANKIRWFSHVRSRFTDCDRRLLPAWQACVRRLPHDIRRLARGPVGYGLGLWVNRAEHAHPKLRPSENLAKPNFQQEKLFELRPTKKYCEIHHYGVFIAALSRVRCNNYYTDDYWYNDYKASGNMVLSDLKGFSLGKLYHNGSSWYDLGYWV